MDVKDLINKRDLRKIFPDAEKVRSSIKISESKLAEAEKLLKKAFFNQVVIISYTSMFHSARAILYRDGIQEKSHYAVFVYLKEKYHNKIPNSLINSFDNYRIERHEALYGFDFEASKDEAESAIEDAKKFLMEVKKLLKNENSKKL